MSDGARPGPFRHVKSRPYLGRRRMPSVVVMPRGRAGDGDRREDYTEQVRDVLTDVHDPCCREKGISVVDMGLLRSATRSATATSAWNSCSRRGGARSRRPS